MALLTMRRCRISTTRARMITISIATIARAAHFSTVWRFISVSLLCEKSGFIRTAFRRPDSTPEKYPGPDRYVSANRAEGVGHEFRSKSPLEQAIERPVH